MKYQKLHFVELLINLEFIWLKNITKKPQKTKEVAKRISIKNTYKLPISKTGWTKEQEN